MQNVERKQQTLCIFNRKLLHVKDSWIWMKYLYFFIYVAIYREIKRNNLG